MTTNNSKLNKTTAVAGTLLTGVFALTSMPANASSLLVEDLGSGAQLRTQLLAHVPVQLQSNTGMELSCGEGKCGEGKCGDDKKKSDAKDADAKKESKAAESKCGEAKCGGDKKADKKADEKKESKAAESKCGEGKCGEQ